MCINCFGLSSTLQWSQQLLVKKKKKWKRAWKLNLIEKFNPDWKDLWPMINGWNPENQE